MSTAQKARVLGIIGGSGLYGLEGLTKTSWKRIESPFGDPSDELLFGELDGVQLVFLPRHGRGHLIPPNAINYRANVDALKRAGVTEVLSLSAVGSLREDLHPGAFVIVDQFIDRTFSRQTTFFGPGLVAHVSPARPVCTRLGDALEAAAASQALPITRGGTYLVMEGPQFSTLAESRMHRAWGCDLVGMTNMPEAKLAREAELCYATVAMVTDFDCWHPGHDAVTVTGVLEVMGKNVIQARALIQALASLLRPLAGGCASGCDTALEHALLTPPEARDPQMVARLQAVAGRVLTRRAGETG